MTTPRISAARPTCGGPGRGSPRSPRTSRRSSPASTASAARAPKPGWGARRTAATKTSNPAGAATRARGERERAARTASTPAAPISSAGGASETHPREEKRFGAIHPLWRNQRDPVAGGQDRFSGRCGQAEVNRTWAAAENESARAKRPRDTGDAIPRATARPARKTTGSRYRLPSDHPPSQFGYPVSRRKKPAVATRAKRQSARSVRERHHARKPGTSQSQKGEKSSSPRAG